MKQLDEHRLQVFEIAVLRKISGVNLRNRHRNEEIRAALEMELDTVEIMRRRRLSYFGHVSRMKPVRLPISIMQGR